MERTGAGDRDVTGVGDIDAAEKDIITVVLLVEMVVVEMVVDVGVGDAAAAEEEEDAVEVVVVAGAVDAVEVEEVVDRCTPKLIRATKFTVWSFFTCAYQN